MTPKETKEMIDAIGWFKKQFGSDVQSALNGTLFTLDMLVAIALQETYVIWKNVYKTKPRNEVLELCVGDTLDAVASEPGEHTRAAEAFPQSRKVLEDAPRGPEMFKIARDALLAASKVTHMFDKAVKNPDKFCHGFGLFQYDLQAFKTGDADYFLKKQWVLFPVCLSKCVAVLKAKKKEKYPDNVILSETEMAYVAVAYNWGSKRTDLNKDFRLQGHLSNDGRRYGANFWDFMQLSKKTPASH